MVTKLVGCIVYLRKTGTQNGDAVVTEARQQIGCTVSDSDHGQTASLLDKLILQSNEKNCGLFRAEGDCIGWIILSNS